jgi:Peptidase family S41
MARSTSRVLVFAPLSLAIILGACGSVIRVPSTPPVPASMIGRVLARDDALADLDALMHTLEDVHPDLYAVRPRDSVVAMRQRIVAELPDSMTRIEWWIRLSPLVASFGDGHTNLAYPGEEIRQGQNAGVLVFPPSVALDEDARLVIASLFGTSADLARGDRILKVNGRNADSLVTAWMTEVSGESNVYRATSVTVAFRDLLLIHSIRAPYALTVGAVKGAERTVTLPGISRDSLVALLRRGQPATASSPGFAYRTIDPGIGYMNFRSMGVDLARFRSDVAAMFRRVAADSDRVLIVDLRTNGGGDTRLGDELLRYVTTHPYRFNARKDWKMSAEYRSYVKSFIRPPLGWLPVQYLFAQGRAMFRGPSGKIVTLGEQTTTPDRAEPFFSGAVCVLIGPRTFSSAADFADAVKTYHLATVLGDETGGRANGFGEVYPFRLPRSGLAVSVSSARYVRASGDTTDHSGVVPDVIVRPTAADRQAGRDVVLDRARSCQGR